MTTVASTLLTVPITGRDHIRGSSRAVGTLIEYGDYACPRCNEARSVVKRLQAALGDRLKYTFRNFPMLRHTLSPIGQPKRQKPPAHRTSSGRCTTFFMIARPRFPTNTLSYMELRLASIWSASIAT